MKEIWKCRLCRKEQEFKENWKSNPKCRDCKTTKMDYVGLTEKTG